MTDGLERSSLDEAWAELASGRLEDAMRRCVAALEAESDQLGALALLARLVLDAGRPASAGKAAERLTDAYTRRGDLARALAASELARRAGRSVEPLRRAIASAFAKESRRVVDGLTPPPPPLRAHRGTALELPDGGPALLDRAEALLRAFAARRDPVAKNCPLPRVPLFGALSARSLEALLGVWELRELAAGEPAIEEGAEGRDAFLVVRGSLRAERSRGGEHVVLATLWPGALFGEMSLVSDAPRAASVIAEEPVQLLATSRDSLEELARKTPALAQQLGEFCRERMVSNLMRHGAILGAVAPADRPVLMSRFAARSFEPGERMITRGAEPEGLFLIASGGVRVLGRDADGDELLVAMLGPGDVVGEISLVLRRPAVADVVATHPTLALELLRDQFQAAIREHPSLLGELYELATKREDEMRSVVAQRAVDVEEVVLL